MPDLTDENKNENEEVKNRAANHNKLYGGLTITGIAADVLTEAANN